MDRHELQAVVEDSWHQLDGAIDGLDEARMAQPGVVEGWSVKDLLGHITAWEQVALRHVEQWREGQPLGLGGASMDAYNAGESTRRREWLLAAVREEAAETRQRLRAMLGSLTDVEWATVVRGEGHEMPLGDWVGGALGGAIQGAHAAEHAAQILAWRGGTGGHA